MTVEEFNPHGATGEDEKDMFYRELLTGPQGMRFELLKEKHHTGDDVDRAKRYLHRHFDVVKIYVVKE
jgi:hypothetical protein